MKYAIIESGGKQYKTTEGDVIEVDRLQTEINKKVELDKVLMVVDDDKISIGTPTLKGLKVSAKVISHEKGPKVTIFKYRPKKRIRVKTGHRQQYTQLKIEKIGKE